ncbi:MAG: hypothetical protein QOK30_1497, partial [Nocardioidaceae bacterium]|nr:hypothetical protein [Nocardioidaceae bacterium]
PESLIVETLIEEAMRLADSMGEPVDDDGTTRRPGTPVVTVS